jgi:4-diphosphocytidyl-2-C-methyl-D-erythritol kinase
LTPLAERARAKINLTLRVLKRRADGYHDLESFVAFADLADRLTWELAPETLLEVGGPFAQASGAPSDNLVMKAVAALAELVPSLRSGRFFLDKQIPVAAGIGGGSADAAAALRLLAHANGLALDDARLMTAAMQVGADVPVCLSSRACVMTGVGERLSPPLELPKLHAVLVNPGVALSTRDAFSAFAKIGTPATAPQPGAVPLSHAALIEFLSTRDNDLTGAAIACVPAIADVLAALRALPGAQLARMSGSGATCFALLGSSEEAAAAASGLAAAHHGWWVAPVTLS